ncbi:MAG TPA: hypothetical protein VG871_03745, partial [Vicinamibacterales bacterium]|nr:hypothetical protein [Vicinamibacterales bacterium]
VAFQYDKRQRSNDYSRVVPIVASSVHEPTRVFAPVYASTFEGVVLPRGRPGCVAGVYWVDPQHQPLVLDVTLAPGWEHTPLYQRLSFEPRFGSH